MFVGLQILTMGRVAINLALMTMEENLKYSKHKEIKGKKAYDKYDNYDAIEVSFTDAIPSDYDGVMGVPISFWINIILNSLRLLEVIIIIKEGLPPQIVVIQNGKVS